MRPLGVEVSRRVGVIVPPENPTVEPEMVSLLAEDTTLHVARLPLSVGADLRGRLEGYRAGLHQTLDQFGGLRLDAMLIACTGAFYTSGPDEDERLCRELSDDHGIPVRTATRAIMDVLRERDCPRVIIVSPYPSWLTEAAQAYWAAAGVEVTKTVEISDGRPIYSLGTDEVRVGLEAAARDPGDADAVLISGTGVPTVAAIRALQPAVAPTLLSSNLCGGWWLTARKQPAVGGRA